jgi:ABC-2 type transport system ATP-binding protein
VTTLSAPELVSAPAVAPARPLPPALEALHLGRSFGDVVALRDASLIVQPGEIRALLGPNGAGKTTLLRILAGLVEPSSGEVSVLGRQRPGRARRARVGLVPASDRSFYLRISGLENLVFFSRLHGMRRRLATTRSREVLDLVGLAEAADRRVGVYSHGMQKRLAVARALLTDPPLLLVDEATHDLDPEGGQRIRALIRGAADRGAAVVWATQRLDEIRGFADSATVLRRGEARFAGTVAQLIEHAVPRRHLVQIAGGPSPLALQRALGFCGTLEPAGGEHHLLELTPGENLGGALSALALTPARILACRPEHPEVEEAFLSLVAEEAGAA